ncbi:MAG: SLC13 family permease [Nitrososphaerales archaeon]
MELAAGNVLALTIFAAVYGLIIVRNVKGVNLPVWAIMCSGALTVLLLQLVPVQQAYSAINFHVIFFLLGMFAIVSGLEVSGLLKYVTLKVLQYAKTPDRVLMFILMVLGAMSAFLINDTIALVATPIVIGFAHQMRVMPRTLLITLAFAVTIGSMMTPIGNPQNLLIALQSGIANPFLEFLKYLALPAFANLFITYYLVRWYYRKELSGATVPIIHVTKTVIADMRLAKLSAIASILVVTGFFIVGILELTGFAFGITFSHVALLGGMALIAISGKPRQIIKSMNWTIILFFIAMFVFMEAIWDSGVSSLFNYILPALAHSSSPLTLINIILASVGASQLLSNVPFVALYWKVMQGIGFTGIDTKAWMSLAGGSTLAGNLTILGAASNVIILQAAEERKHTFTFIEFLKIGAIVTPVNMVVLMLFLILLP